jgi:hypothetical protein
MLGIEHEGAMRTTMKTHEIDEASELLRLVEEVRSSNQPRLLRHNGEDLALLLPVPRRRGRRAAAPDLAALRSAAGGWKGVDTDRLLADVYADRKAADRAPVRL